MKTFTDFFEQKQRLVNLYFSRKERAQQSLKGVCVHDSIFQDFNFKWDKYFTRIERSANKVWKEISKGY